MATNRTVIDTTAVGAGATVNVDLSPITNGKTWIVTQFGAATPVTSLIAITGIVDARTDMIVLKFGTVGNFTDIAVIIQSAQTFFIPMEHALVGDGSKFVRFTKTNSSGASRTTIVWAHAYEPD